MNQKTVSLNRDIQARARQEAERFRHRLTRQGTLVVNLVSSPGAGKTALLEAAARYWRGSVRMAALVGDLATDRDAQRLAPLMPVRQLTTGGACHLELSLVQRGLEQLGGVELDFLFIENVGNLVCTASHDLGEHLRVVLLSTTEGDDKPGKYPKMFRTSDCLVITKIDLLAYLPFSVEAAVTDARRVQPQIEAFSVCSLTGDGLAGWCSFLEEKRRALVAKDHVSITG